MGNLKLCYGLKVDAGEWAKALGIKYGENKAKTCSFCGNTNPKENNFCGNCGSDLRQSVADLSSTDIIELTMTRLGGPPTPVQLLPGKNCIYLCQVLANGYNGFAAFQKPIDQFHWKGIGNAISTYAEQPDLDSIKPYLFALDEDAKKEK